MVTGLVDNDKSMLKSPAVVTVLSRRAKLRTLASLTGAGFGAAGDLGVMDDNDMGLISSL